jgi:Spy/CpxP family protein refolding chaperone
MNKGRVKTLAIATLSAIALAASIAVAQTVTTNQGTQQGTRTERRGGRGGHKGHGWGGMREGGFFKQLNLTEDQKTKIKQIRETFANQTNPCANSFGPSVRSCVRRAKAVRSTKHWLLRN